MSVDAPFVLTSIGASESLAGGAITALTAVPDLAAVSIVETARSTKQHKQNQNQQQRYCVWSGCADGTIKVWAVVDKDKREGEGVKRDKAMKAVGRGTGRGTSTSTGAKSSNVRLKCQQTMHQVAINSHTE